MIDYHQLKTWQFPETRQSYTGSDCRLYALGLNLGHDPCDQVDLRHVAHEPAVPLPTMATNLCRLGSWMKNPATGIDYSKIVIGGVGLRLFRPLPECGQVSAQHEVASVVDKGEGRGALVTVRRTLKDETGSVLAEYEQTTFCRANGGFSAKDGTTDQAPPKPTASFDAACDFEFEHPTLPQQALIYRLTGDSNPLHSDPDVARKAGFPRPILHGLATFGIAGWTLIKNLCPDRPEALHSLSCRMSRPVLPGSLLKTRVWTQGESGHLSFEVYADGVRVLSNGMAQIIPNSG